MSPVWARVETFLNAIIHKPIFKKKKSIQITKSVQVVCCGLLAKLMVKGWGGGSLWCGLAILSCGGVRARCSVTVSLHHSTFSFWMAMHLRKCWATPSAYLDLWEGLVDIWSSKMTARNSARKTVVVKRAISQVILNHKGLQPVTTMYSQWTVNKTGNYLATVQFLLSPLEII